MKNGGEFNKKGNILATLQPIKNYETPEFVNPFSDANSDFFGEFDLQTVDSAPIFLLRDYTSAKKKAVYKPADSMATNELPESVPPDNESPFDYLDRKLPDEEKVDKLILQVRSESKIEYAERLADRLTYLHEAVLEDPEEEPIPFESLRNFITFLLGFPKFKYPDVVLTPSSEISCEWRTGPNRFFSIIFTKTRVARYVIFKPNFNNSDIIDRISGMTTTDALMQTIKNQGLLNWITDA